MRGTVQLIQPDRDGKIPVERGDVIWWIDGVPHKFKVNLWPTVSEEKAITK